MRRKDCILQWGINENLMIFERGKSQASNKEKKDVKHPKFTNYIRDKSAKKQE